VGTAAAASAMNTITAAAVMLGRGSVGDTA
jgi:hypothetical protein